MIVNKITDAIDLFRLGTEVTNKAAWKTAGNIVPILTATLMAGVKLAGDFGYGISLSTQDATSIATGITAVFMFVIHNITSKDAGILPARSEAVQ